MPQSFMVSQRSWQSPVTTIVRMLPYLALASNPPPKLHSSPTISMLLPNHYFLSSSYLTSQEHLIGLTPPLFKTPSSFGFHDPTSLGIPPISQLLPPPLDLTCKCGRTFISQGSGLSFLAALFKAISSFPGAQIYFSSPNFSSVFQTQLLTWHFHLDDSQHLKFKLTLDLDPARVTPLPTLPFPLTAPLCTQS